jgi:hypothetical protein
MGDSRLILSTITIACYLLVSFIHAGCTTDGASTEFQLPVGYQWYSNGDYDYRIAYPTDWILVPEEEISLGEGILSSVMIKYDPDMSLGSLSVSIASDYDIDEALEMGAESKVKNDMEYYYLDLEGFLGTNQRLAVFPADDKYYVIQYFARPEYFEKHVEVFDKVIASFTIDEGIIPLSVH